MGEKLDNSCTSFSPLDRESRLVSQYKDPQSLRGFAIVTAIEGLLKLSKIDPNSFTFASSIKSWPIAFFCLTLVTNASCTALIAYRIWRIEQQTLIVFKSRRLSPVVAIIIESGAIYSVFLIILIATYVPKSWSQYIFLNAVRRPLVLALLLTNTVLSWFVYY